MKDLGQLGLVGEACRSALNRSARAYVRNLRVQPYDAKMVSRGEVSQLHPQHHI